MFYFWCYIAFAHDAGGQNWLLKLVMQLMMMVWAKVVMMMLGLVTEIDADLA